MCLSRPFRETSRSADFGWLDAARKRAGKKRLSGFTPIANESRVFQRASRLVADDREHVREALRLLLKQEGFKIETACSPASSSRP